MVFGVVLVPLDPQVVLDLRELLDLLVLREPRDPLVLRDLQGLPEPLQRLLLLKAEVESHRHRTQTIKVVPRLLVDLLHLARSGGRPRRRALVSVMQLNLPLSRHVLSYQEMSMVPPFAPATLQR
jgi:hypothetical protein